MKNLIIALLCSVMLTSCGNGASIGIIGGTDGPTNIYVSGKYGEQYEKKPIRMINVGGELYFDSGLASDMTPRCGTLDGNLNKTAVADEIPKSDGGCNFDADGYQTATSITKEVPIDGDWVIFKKFTGIYGASVNLSDFKYCFYIKGHLNNAVIDSELVVLTNDADITFSDVYEPMFSSLYTPEEKMKEFVYDYVVSGDKWGISLRSGDVTARGMTICIEQFAGSATGKLQTGEWYELQGATDDGWRTVETKVDNAVWHTMAYGIRNNDITELEVDWQQLYGELPCGSYRIAKKIMDFRGAGDYDEELYYVYFDIE